MRYRALHNIAMRLQSVVHILTSPTYLVITEPFDIAKITADKLEFYREHLELSLERVNEFIDEERLNAYRQNQKAKTTDTE